MKIKHLILLSNIILILIISCKRDTQTYEGIITIDLSKELKDISESGQQYFKSLKFVQLETNENALIGSIDEVIITDNRIYILDSYRSNSVFIFDRQGNWVNTIKKIGQGPEEYYILTDIFFDDKTNSINLLCRANNKIMEFDVDGKKLLSQHQIPLHLFEIKKCNTYYFGDSSNSTGNPEFNSNINILSPDFKVVYQSFSIDSAWLFNAFGTKTLSLYRNFVNYYNPLDDKIYRLTENSSSELCHYNFGDFTFPYEWRKPEYFIPPHKVNLANYVSKLCQFQETDKYYIGYFIFKGAIKLSFYSKETKENYTYDILDCPFLSAGFGNIRTMSEKYIIAQISNYSAEQIISDKDNGYELLEKQIKWPLEEDNNPILLLYELK